MIPSSPDCLLSLTSFCLSLFLSASVSGCFHIHLVWLTPKIVPSTSHGKCLPKHPHSMPRWQGTPVTLSCYSLDFPELLVHVCNWLPHGWLDLDGPWHLDCNIQTRTCSFHTLLFLLPSLLSYLQQLAILQLFTCLCLPGYL